MRRSVVEDGGALTMGGVVRANMVRWEGVCVVGKAVLVVLKEEGKYGEERPWVGDKTRDVAILCKLETCRAAEAESFGSCSRPAAAQFVPPDRNVIRIDFWLARVWSVRIR